MVKPIPLGMYQHEEAFSALSQHSKLTFQFACASKGPYNMSSTFCMTKKEKEEEGEKKGNDSLQG